MKRRFYLVLACCVFFCQNLWINTYAAVDWPMPAVEVGAQAGIVIDADSGAVLYEKDADTLYPPASTTKILTALVVLENCENLDDVVTISKTAMERVEPDSGNPIGVSEGDRLTVEDCLYALLLRSSNEVANAAAEYTAGSIDEFVAMMNAKAGELGLTESHFENPSGLNGDIHNVTARELAVISRAAYQNEKLLEISSTVEYRLPALIEHPDGFTVINQHRLIKTSEELYYEAAVAGKTGYLLKAGNTLITYAEQDGRKLISVVLQGTRSQYFVDSRNLLEWGFAGFENFNSQEHDKTEFTDQETASLAEREITPTELSPRRNAVVTLPKGATFDDVSRTLSYDLPAGHPPDAVALLEYAYDGRLVGSAYLEREEADEPVTGVTESVDDALPGDLAEASGDEQNVAGRSTLPWGRILLFLLMAALIGGGGFFVYRMRKEEARKQEERRRKRKQRLEEIGISAEEFEQMLDAHRRSGK